MKIKETKKIKITCLTPVLIGSGEKFQAGFDYVKENGKIHKINFDKFVETLNPEGNQFLSLYKKLTETGENKQSIFSIQQFFKKQDIDYTDFIDYTIKDVSKGELRGQYETTLTVRTKNKPYIPGSSLKGTLETPLYNDNKGESLMKNHYFRSLMVRDLEMKSIEETVYFSNLSVFNFNFKNANKAGRLGATMYAECLKPHSEFETELKIFSTGSGNTYLGSIESLLEKSNERNIKILESEINFFEKNIKMSSNIKPDLKETAKSLLVEQCDDLLDVAMGKNETYLIRLGAGSGMKSMVLKDPFTIKRFHRGKPGPIYSRKAIEENENPKLLGWAKVEVME